MDIVETKKRVGELLSRITVRNNEDGDPYSHLEANEWIELDTVKYELAREKGAADFIGSMSYRDELLYSFTLGDGIATATLRYDVPNERVDVEIRLVGDPTVNDVDQFAGDENQAWTLFHSLPADERDEFLEFLRDTYRIIPEQVATMIGDEAPEPGPNPAHLPRVPAPSSKGPTP
jgi:hypothetical protein